VIRLLSAPGELVLDPFVGSGTSAVAAVQEQRRFIGVDRMPRYVEMARQAMERALACQRKLPFEESQEESQQAIRNVSVLADSTDSLAERERCTRYR